MIKILAVGKIKEKAMQQLLSEYLKRLQPYVKIEIMEVADEQAPQTNSDAQNEIVKLKEGERVLARIREQDYVILLDLAGKMMSSEQLAAKFEQLQTYQSCDITFVIGGSLGLSTNLMQRANFRLKISDMTFPHQIVRLLLVEQIYRSYKINAHEPYHK